LLLASSSWASDSFSVSGIVHDTTGAVIPGASITVRQPQGDAAQSTQTDAQGSFQIPLPAAGTYQLEVQAGGFMPHHTQATATSQNPDVKVEITVSVQGATQTV